MGFIRNNIFKRNHLIVLLFTKTISFSYEVAIKVFRNEGFSKKSKSSVGFEIPGCIFKGGVEIDLMGKNGVYKNQGKFVFY